MSRTGRRRLGLVVFLALIVAAVVFLFTLDTTRGRPATAVAGAPVRIPIGVERGYDDTVVTVPVTIDGQEFRFALDTGASTSAVNGTVLTAIRATDTGEDARFVDASGRTEDSRLFRIGSWSIGSVSLQDEAVVSDLARPLDVDGLLGSDQLSRFGRVTIDYDAEVLVITPRRR